METDNLPCFKGIAEDGGKDSNEECESLLRPDTVVRKRGDTLRKTWNGSEAQQRRKYLQACAETGQLQSAAGNGAAKTDGWRHKLTVFGGRGSGGGGGGTVGGLGKESAGSRRVELLPPRDRLVPLVPRPATRIWDVTSYRSGHGGADGRGAVIGKSWRKLDSVDGGAGGRLGDATDQDDIELVKIKTFKGGEEEKDSPALVGG
ncbi:hypothetical protein RRG08_018569 [Elysia crispata]|uniref:Uncharacterized protein n=1 Tax=Elysia crispata TaxID=231223 RepID=A0AAE1CPY4_9GAST|nr:hypothetical protein RRG08_018569 [Elysia crispata]